VGTLIQIGLEVSLTERALQDVVSVWGQPRSHGRVGSNQAFLSAHRKHNTLLHVFQLRSHMASKVVDKFIRPRDGSNHDPM
jgi:hypothetical protein